MTQETQIRLWAGCYRAGVCSLLILVSACTAALEAPSQAIKSPGKSPAAQAPLPKVSLCLQDGSHRKVIRAERAATFAQRQRGLMGRQRLAPDQGMLFLYEQERPADSSFWMYQTLLPLDIAYLGRAGEIRAIQAMAPCPGDAPGSCPSYPAGVPYRAALEMNQGFFAEHGFAVGARVSRSTPEQCRLETP